MTTGKTTAFTRWTFGGKVMSLLFSMLSGLVITFFPRSKRLLISWLQSPSAVILEPRKIKSATVSNGYPSICHEVMGPDTIILVFWMLSFKPTFSFSSFTFMKRFFSSFSLSANRVVSSAYLRLLIFLPESTQTHVHWVYNAIQPSHPLSCPCPPALNLSQHQGLFQWVSSLHQVAKVLKFQPQHQSFQWTLRTDLL